MSDVDPSELYQVIGQGLLDGAPEDRVEAGASWCSVGNFAQGSFFAILEDGEKETFNGLFSIKRGDGVVTRPSA